MNKSILAFSVCVAASSAIAENYKCPQAGGMVYSDPPCIAGKVRRGDQWLSVKEVEQKKREEKLESEQVRLETERARKQAEEAKAAGIAEQKRQDEIVWRHKITPYGASTTKPTSVPNASDVDKLTTYAVVLGRSISCGVNTADVSKRIGRWFDEAFTLGTAGHATYLVVFSEGVKLNAEQQRAGHTPDSCTTITKNFNSFPWPK